MLPYLLQLNGINTQGENIADNGGIKESYIAYKHWVEKNGAEPTLPGLNYSPQQMFWISGKRFLISSNFVDDFMSITSLYSRSDMVLSLSN